MAGDTIATMSQRVSAVRPQSGNTTNHLLTTQNEESGDLKAEDIGTEGG